MLDSVTGFVFFAHGPSFQNGVGLGSPISVPSANGQQRTNLGTLGFFLGRFQFPLRHRMDRTSRFRLTRARRRGDRIKTVLLHCVMTLLALSRHAEIDRYLSAFGG